ncbi:hypothetical protein M6B38_267165 [Iris pallida]|uniref:Uncharacterized protein n=1 Tax=Iris pallida TaxID=29817 RepID=A0AAX6GKD6_IRIPA|nr:hypothetical protein M6B38_360420 [Iris pallida]KAJ6849851.1 hypothetical protein M6B38_267165 [Iris pallida]
MLLLQGCMLLLGVSIGSVLFGFYLQDSVLKSLKPDRWRGSKALQPHNMARVLKIAYLSLIDGVVAKRCSTRYG